MMNNNNNNNNNGSSSSSSSKEEEEEELWKIFHIPDTTPIPPHLQPTVNVYASVIDPKHANTLVRKLNKLVPLENLRHVKRVRSKSLQGGKNQLEVILCLACGNDGQLDLMPDDVVELIDAYQLSTFSTKVYKYAASSKEEWKEQCKLWPTSYHPPTYNIDGITGFTEEGSQSVFTFMKFAVDMAKSNDGQVVNAAVIVDPSTNQVIASACDQVLSWDKPINKSNAETGCFEKREASTLSPSVCNGVGENHKTCSVSNCSSDESKRSLYNGVCCLHPFRWSEQQFHHTNSGLWHPLRHAAIVAVEYSAARDRQFFPGSSGHVGDQFIQPDFRQSPLIGELSPSKEQKADFTNVENGAKLNSHSKDGHSELARPYLCTGYDIYLVWEPCTMCAMALVHQRIKRIFYAFPNIRAGALGSSHRLQGEKSLNHHYAAFRVLLPLQLLEE